MKSILQKTTLIIVCLFFWLQPEAKAQNEVAIGSSTTKSNAILWLNGNGSQGLLLPVVTSKSAVSNPDKGMIVYDDSDNKVWYRNNTAWVEVAGGGGGGSTANLNLLLQGNALQLRDGTTVLNSVNIAGGTSSNGAFLVFTGGSWQFATLSGDVIGANGALQVNGIKGKTIAALPASTQALVYDPSANSGNGGWVFQAFSGGGGITNVSGTAPVTVTNPTTTPVISLANAGITNALLADNAVTSAKIQDATITGADIANTTITANKLAQSAATSNQVLQWNGTNWVPVTLPTGGTVTQVNSGTGLTGGPITNSGTLGIAAGGVSSTELADNAVTSAKISDGTITGADIANTTITADKIAQSSATTGQVLKWNGTNWVPQNDDAGSGAVPTLKDGEILIGDGATNTAATLSGDANLTGGTLTITDNAITTAKINAGAVDATKLANDAVTSAKILDGTIANADISGSAAIAVTKLAPGTNGQVLTTAGGVPTWQVQAVPTSDLNSLTDVTIATPAGAQILVNDGAGQFKNVSAGGDATLSTTGSITLTNSAATRTNLGLGGLATLNSVTSAEITDGTITNVDVNATAAIAGTKVSPDFGSQNIITTGSVGINSSPPTEKLDVGGSIKFSGALMPNNTAGSVGQVLTSSGPGASPTWAVPSGSFSTLNTIPKGDGSTLVASSIFDDGTNVGIGTITPVSELHIQGNDVLGITSRVQNTNAAGWAASVIQSDSRAYAISASGSAATVAPNSFYVFDGVANSARFVINPAGDIGIGTTSPGAKLDVAGQIKITDGTEGANKVLTSDATGLATWTLPSGSFSTLNTIPKGDGSTLVASSIFDDGTKVGIGTTSPATTVDISANSPTLTLSSTSGVSTSAASALEFRNSINGLIGSISDTGSSDHLQISSFVQGIFFNTNFTTQMELNPLGNLGIGIAPSERLHVNGNIRFSGALMPNNSSGTVGQVLTSSGPGAAPTWSSASGGWSLTGNAGTSPTTNFVGTVDAQDLTFATAGVERARIETTGDFGIGTADPISKLDVAGDINFSTGSTIKYGGSTIISLPAGTGGDNMVIGKNPPASLAGGQGFNVIVGEKALNAGTTTARANVAIGYNAMQKSTTGIDQVAVGTNAMVENVTGTNNTAIGTGTLRAIVNGSDNNTALGFHAGELFTSGTFNTFLGEGTDASNGLTNATAIGSKAVVTTSNTIQLGNSAVTTVNVGTGTTAKLVAGGLQITGGTLASGNVLTSDASGNATWQPAGAGSGWTLSGNTATAADYIGTNNSVPFVIKQNSQNAGKIDNATASTFFGYRSGNGTTGINNTAIGNQAMEANTTGIENTAIGHKALQFNTTANLNTAVGKSALFNQSFSNGNTPYNTNNTAIGYHALYNNQPISTQTGVRNTALGYFAGVTNTTGRNNTFLGHEADAASGALENATAIGYKATVGASNSIALGGTGSESVKVGIAISSPLYKLHSIQDEGFVDNTAAVYGSNTSAANSGYYGAMAYQLASSRFGVYAHSDAIGGTVPLGVNRGADGALVSFFSGGTIQGQITVSGTTVSYNAFTGSHYGDINEPVERGMLVTLTGENDFYNGNGDGELIHGIRVSSIPNDPKILGSYLGPVSPDRPTDSSNPHQVMAVGNGDMWVINTGEDLEIGDYLISSEVAGHAMLEKGEYDIAYVIARVSQPVDWDDVETVIEGVKHTKISVFYESFMVNNKAEKLQREIDEMKTDIEYLKHLMAIDE